MSFLEETKKARKQTLKKKNYKSHFDGLLNKAKSKSSPRPRANKDIQDYQGYQCYQGYQG